MTALLGALALAVLLAATVLLRARAEARLRAAAERRIHELDAELTLLRHRLQRRTEQEREWLAVLAHELRSPLSAVLGYGELLADGALGPLDRRPLDAVHRVRQAADQLLRLIEGIEEMGNASVPGSGAVQSLSAHQLLTSAAETLRTDAAARGTSIIVEDGDLALTTRPDDARRSLLLALGAAIKASPGETLRLSARHGTPAALVIAGSRLDPHRDEPEHADPTAAPRLTGAGLRIALARRTARLVHGTLAFDPTAAGSLRLELPSLHPLSPIDGAEDRP
jgi:signal transduction histidine kinase